MSALLQLASGPGLGQLFDNFQNLKELIEDWSIKEKFLFIVTDKDQSYVIYKWTGYIKISSNWCVSWLLEGRIYVSGLAI